MKPVSTPLAYAMAILVLFLVLGILLIPVLEAELRRATAKKFAAEAATNDNARATARKPERQIG